MQGHAMYKADMYNVAEKQKDGFWKPEHNNDRFPLCVIFITLLVCNTGSHRSGTQQQS